MEQAARLSPSKLVLTSVLEPKDELNEVFTVIVEMLGQYWKLYKVLQD